MGMKEERRGGENLDVGQVYLQKSSRYPNGDMELAVGYTRSGKRSGLER